MRRRRKPWAAAAPGPEALDLIGAGLLVLGAGWDLVSGFATGADPTAQLGGLSLVALAYIGGRACVAIARPTAAAVGGAVLLYLLATFVLTGGELPLGYDNADAALLVLGAGALTLYTSTSAQRDTRVLGVIAAVLVVAAALLMQAATATVGGLLVAAAALASIRVPGVRPVLLAWITVAVAGAAVAVTAVLGLARDERNPAVSISGQVLTDRRLDLWHDAVRLVWAHPLVGVGPGRYALESVHARADPDAVWAHSLPLQQAAETGLPGLLVLMALGCWCVLRLAVAAAPETGQPQEATGLLNPRLAAAVVGIATWTAFVLASSVDYVASFVMVSAPAAFVLGLATDMAGSRDQRRPRR